MVLMRVGMVLKAGGIPLSQAAEMKHFEGLGPVTSSSIPHKTTATILTIEELSEIRI